MSKVDFKLYFITNRLLSDSNRFYEVIKKACYAGVKAIQLREKNLTTVELYRMAEDIIKICSQTKTILFINDRLDVANAVQAGGIHLTSRSLPITAIRNQIRNQMLVGISTHSLNEVRRAEENSCDFVLFGPVFDTPEKRQYGQPQGLNRLADVCRNCSIPVFAVGGINYEKVKSCLDCGAYGVAVISAIMKSHNVDYAINQFKEELGCL